MPKFNVTIVQTRTYEANLVVEARSEADLCEVDWDKAERENLIQFECTGTDSDGPDYDRADDDEDADLKVTRSGKLKVPTKKE